MPKPVEYNFSYIHFKLSQSLNYNLKLLSNNKATAHLISIQKLEKGFLLAEENKPMQGIYFILKGKVMLYNADFKQESRISWLASKGDIVGLSSLNTANYWSTAVTLGAVEVYFINIKSLEYILQNNTKLSLLFVKALSMKLHNYEIRQRYLDLFPARERIIETLLFLGSKFGEVTEKGTEINDCTTRRKIASLAKISTENTIRILSALIKKNYIVVEGKKIIIKNKEELINQLKKYCCSQKLPNTLNACYLDVLN